MSWLMFLHFWQLNGILWPNSHVFFSFANFVSLNYGTFMSIIVACDNRSGFHEGQYYSFLMEAFKGHARFVNLLPCLLIRTYLSPY